MSEFLLTPEQAQEIEAMLEEGHATESVRITEPVEVRIIDQREEKDVSPALEGIASAIKANGVADALAKLRLSPTIKMDMDALANTMGVVAKAISGIKPIDIAPLVAAINENTKEMRAMRKAYESPRAIMFNDNNEIVGARQGLPEDYN